MAAVTEEDLQEKRERNADLLEQIADAEAQQAGRLQEQNNAIEATQLDAETARLEARLRDAKAAAEEASVKDGASGVLNQVTEELRAAESARNAPVGPIDTNSGADTNETKEV